MDNMILLEWGVVHSNVGEAHIKCCASFTPQDVEILAEALNTNKESHSNLRNFLADVLMRGAMLRIEKQINELSEEKASMETKQKDQSQN